MNNKVIGTDGRQYPWTLTGYIVKENATRPRSTYHLRCRTVVRKLYPTLVHCEEVVLPGTGNQSLDFYLPDIRLAIEVQGPQHYTRNSKFHANDREFIEGQRLDANKRRWCELNNVRLVELRFDRTDDEWVEQITDG